jgi:hypothetical protein
LTRPKAATRFFTEKPAGLCRAAGRSFQSLTCRKTPDRTLIPEKSENFELIEGNLPYYLCERRARTEKTIFKGEKTRIRVGFMPWAAREQGARGKAFFPTAEISAPLAGGGFDFPEKLRSPVRKASVPKYRRGRLYFGVIRLDAGCPVFSSSIAASCV